jgi:hypothetical protein
MKKLLYIILILGTMLSSCEKVIDVDLKDAEPKMVVEGYLTNHEGINLVVLSKTNSFYTNEEPEMLIGADVVMIDEFGVNFTLEEIGPGYYNNKNFKGLVNHNYKLSISVDNVILESQSYSPSDVMIDSIKTALSEFGGPGSGGGRHNDGEKEKYSVTCYFSDPVDEINFYRLRISVNNEYLSGFHVVDDKFFNGKTIPFQFNGIELVDGDELRVELMGIDENNYQYYYTLSRILGAGQDITPGNPPTNIVGDAIGIFGANTFDVNTVFFIDE